MSPIREFSCTYCDHFWEEVILSRDPEDYRTSKCRCGSYASYVPSVSATPQGSFNTVSRKTGKTSHKRFNGNVDEPEKKQLEFNFDDKD